MNAILKQVARARRRILIGQFFRALIWSVFAFLLVASIAVAVRRIWHFEIKNEFLATNWDWLILSAAGILALGTSLVVTLIGRPTTAQAAVEIDQRFQLKDRLASALMMEETIANSSQGKALLEDAAERAELIDVRDEFPFRTSWTLAMPVLPAVIVGVLLLIPMATAKEPEPEAKKTVAIDKKAVKIAVEVAKEKMKKKSERLTESGLKDAIKGMETIQNKIDKIAEGSEAAKKDALANINSIKKQLTERQKKLGGAEQLKKSLNQLGKAVKGPAKKVADAMKKGDFKAAKDAVKDLAKKLKDGKLSETEKKKLANDISELAKEMKKMAKRREEAKQDLKNKIEQAKNQGDLDKAAKLQKKLEDMQQQDKQMDRMKKMADKLKKAADAMKEAQNRQQSGDKKQGEGDSQSQPGQQGGQKGMEDAAEALEDIAEEMEQMQRELDELGDLEDLQKDLDDLKQQMQGGQGDGEGGGDKPQWNDWGKGQGQGGGKRADDENKTGNYDSKVKAKLQKGQAVKTGSANGANLKGGSVNSAREAIKTSMNSETDPLENQKLPRSVREHASQYFEKLRKGD